MNENLSKSFGAVIREIRNSKSMSQEALAFKAGVHRTYIGMVERGEKNITLENIQKLAIALNIPMSDILQKLEDSAK